MNQEGKHIKRAIEGLLFSSPEPISLGKMREALESLLTCSLDELREAVKALQEEYIEQNRAFRLEEIGGGFLLKTTEDLAPCIAKLFKNTREQKLSPSSSEVLAIIAYRAPITRPQIEEIRGVDSSGSIHTLLERGLIEPLGKLEVPGRPTLYGVTNRFLQHFGLRAVSDLPGYKEIEVKEIF